MMLRKRSRSHQKDQPMLDSPDRTSSGSHFTVPGLFVGLSNRVLSDSDAVRSPTSPLEFRVCSSVTEPFIMSPRSSQNGHQLNLGCTKVGLSLVDTLHDDMKPSGEVIFGPGMRVRSPKGQTHVKLFQEPKSLPKDYPVFPQTQTKNRMENGKSRIVFEIGEDSSELEPPGFKTRSCSLDTCSFSSLAPHEANSSLEKICLRNTVYKVISPADLSGGRQNSDTFSDMGLKLTSGSLESLSASEVELSEDYTCVISRGPNPKTTHIYGDQVLECHDDKFSNFSNAEGKQIPVAPAVAKTAAVFPSDNFLSFCYFCNNKLEEGKDIFIYRGEKAFCSLDCRSHEIAMDEETEEAVDKSSKKTTNLDNGKELGIIFTTE